MSNIWCDENNVKKPDSVEQVDLPASKNYSFRILKWGVGGLKVLC
jgi:hypothetical protein